MILGGKCPLVVLFENDCIEGLFEVNEFHHLSLDWSYKWLPWAVQLWSALHRLHQFRIYSSVTTVTLSYVLVFVDCSLTYNQIGGVITKKCLISFCTFLKSWNFSNFWKLLDVTNKTLGAALFKSSHILLCSHFSSSFM